MAPSAAPLPSAAAVEQHHESFRRCVDDWDSRVSVLTHQVLHRLLPRLLLFGKSPAVNPHSFSSATPEFPSSNAASSVVGGTIADQHEDGDAGEAGDSDAEDRGDREEREGRDGDGGSEESQEERHDSRGLGGPAEARGEGGTSKSGRPQGDDSEAGRDRSEEDSKKCEESDSVEEAEKAGWEGGSVVEEGREGTGGVEGEEQQQVARVLVELQALVLVGKDLTATMEELLVLLVTLVGGEDGRGAGWWDGGLGEGEADEGLQELLRSDWFKSTEYFTPALDALAAGAAVLLVIDSALAANPAVARGIAAYNRMLQAVRCNMEAYSSVHSGAKRHQKQRGRSSRGQREEFELSLAELQGLLMMLEAAIGPQGQEGTFFQSWKESAAWAVGPEAPPLAAAAKAGKGGKGGRAKASGGRQVLSGRALWRQQQKWLLPLVTHLNASAYSALHAIGSHSEQHNTRRHLAGCIALFLSLAPIAASGYEKQLMKATPSLFEAVRLHPLLPLAGPLPLSASLPPLLALHLPPALLAVSPAPFSALGEGKGGGKAGAKGAGGKGGVKAVKGSAEKRGNGGESARGVREVCEDVLRGALDRANEDLPRLASAFPPLAASLSAALRLPLRLSLQCDSLEEAVGSQVKLVEQTLAVTCSARHQVQTLLELHASLRVSLKRRQIVLVAAVLQAIKQVESALAACLPSLSLHLPLYQQHLLRQLNAALLPLQVLSGSSQVFFPAHEHASADVASAAIGSPPLLPLDCLYLIDAFLDGARLILQPHTQERHGKQPKEHTGRRSGSRTISWGDVYSLENQLEAALVQSFLRPLTRDVIADLHLHAISHSDLHSANPRFNPRKTGVRNLLQFLQLLPIRLLSRQIDIQAHVTQALAASLYNHTAAAPANWKLGEDVRQLAASKYRLLLPPIAIGGGLAFRLHSPPTSTSTASPALPFSILHPPSLAANLPFFVSAFSFDLSTLTFHQRPSSLASFHEPSSPTPSTRHADSSPAFSSHGPQSLKLRQLAALLQSTHAMLFLQHAATSACKLIAGKLSHLSRLHASTLPAPPVAHSLAYCPSCSLMLFLVCPVESSEISRFPRPLPSSPSPLTLSPLSLASFPPFQELQASSHRPFPTLPAAIPPLSLILASKKQLAQQRRADAVAGGGRDGRVGDFCVDSHTLLFHTPSHLFQELQASPHRPFLTLPAAIPPLSLLLASKKQLAQQRLADAVAGGGRDGRVEGGRNDNGAGRSEGGRGSEGGGEGEGGAWEGQDDDWLPDDGFTLGVAFLLTVANQRLTFESMDWFSLALHHLSFQRQAMPTNPPSTLTPAAAAAVGGGRGASAAGAVGAEKGKSGGGGADVGEEDDEEEEGEGTGGSGRGVTSLWSSWFGAAVAAAEPAASQPELSPELTHQLRQRERMLAGMAEQLSLMNVVTIAALRLFESSSAATQ
ncbi:unnamed protein product [Closterium sp. NIES-65]|nr:unnamed protein product [Closterium sp. NIES-65]